MKTPSNFFEEGLDHSLIPSAVQSGGDLFEVDNAGNIVISTQGTTHPFFEVDEVGDITRKDDWHFADGYLSLITPLYRNKPRFMQWLQSNVRKVPTPGPLSDEFDYHFNIDTATGAQLDIIGVIVDRSRNVDFAFSDGTSSVLDDENYRLLLKAKIVRNLWDGKINSLQPIWNTLFPGSLLFVRDNQDMTMDVFVFGSTTIVFKELVTNGYIVPKPQTVRIRYTFVPNLPAFGYDLDNEFVSGFDRGYWVIPKTDYPFFGFDEDSETLSGFDRGVWSVKDIVMFGFDRDDSQVSGFNAGTWSLGY